MKKKEEILPAPGIKPLTIGPKRYERMRKGARTLAQKAEDVALAGSMRSRRVPYTAILEHLNSRPDRLPVTLAMVHGDCKMAEKLWLRDAKKAVEIGKEEMLAELEAVREEAWTMWQASKKPRVVKSAKKRGAADDSSSSQTESAVVQEERHGDVAALRIILETQERKAKLLGLDAPTKTENVNDNPARLTVIVNAPKDPRPWHEKVYDATGVKIDPMPSPAALDA